MILRLFKDMISNKGQKKTQKRVQCDSIKRFACILRLSKVLINEYSDKCSC